MNASPNIDDLLRKLEDCQKQVSELLIEREGLNPNSTQSSPNKDDSEKWTARDYKNAAQRHKKVCDFILKSNEEKDKGDLCVTAYYLSGYVLECALKAYILESQHNAKGVTKQELEKMGLWNHNLSILWTKACDKGGIKKTDFEWGDLAKNWTESIRYKIKEPGFKDIKKLRDYYDKTVVAIYDKLNKRY